MKEYLFKADILLPDFKKIDGTKWATIACDQFTSEPEYWEKATAMVGESPSTLNLILPEVYLNEAKRRIPKINSAMTEYLKNILVEHKESMIYIEREQSDGKIRHGIIGLIDLEEYDYRKNSKSLIRATEGTVLERIPPRVAVRCDAPIELPHIMLLIDDASKTVIEPCTLEKSKYKIAYDFELMQKGGHVTGRFLNNEAVERINAALCMLASPEEQCKKYGKCSENEKPLLFAVGDGNHSLACAKATYVQNKIALGEDALSHPSRYALVEVVNLHDDALEFEPIYRVLFNVNAEVVLNKLFEYAHYLKGCECVQRVDYCSSICSGEIYFKNSECQLTVGTLQKFIDSFVAEYPATKVDYIHGEQALEILARKKDTIGFIFKGIEKNELFKSVIIGGALPRKAFSMGHAEDKKYYIEARCIK